MSWCLLHFTPAYTRERPRHFESTIRYSNFYSIECQGNAELTYPVADRLLMTLASMLPIARLSCARNGQGILMSRQHVTRIVPADISSVLSVDELLHDISLLNETLPIVSEENVYNTLDHGNIAPFVYVKQHHAGEKEDSQSQAFESRQRESSKIKKTYPLTQHPDHEWKTRYHC
jgi:hypothetical protein